MNRYSSNGAQASRRGYRGARVPGGSALGRPVDRGQPVTAQGGRRCRHDQRADAARAQGAERPLVRDRAAERVPAAGLPAEGHPRDREQDGGAGEAKAGQRHQGGHEHHSPPGTRSPSRAVPTAARAGCRRRRSRSVRCPGRSSSSAARACSSSGRASSSSTRTRSRSARRAWRRLSGSTTSPSASSRSRSRSWAHSPSRRAPTRSCRTGRVGESSGSTAGPTPSVLGQGRLPRLHPRLERHGRLPARQDPGRHADPRRRDLI